MAIVSEYKSQYLLYYRDLTKAALEDGSIFDEMFKRLTKEFDDWGLTPEKKSEITAQTVMTILPQFEQMIEESARNLIMLEHEVPIKDNQASELLRKTQYYDDRLLETVLEKQGDLASFAVNANSDSAQTTINDLKTKMSQLEGRVVPVSGNDCPAPNPVIAIPSGLNAVANSDVQVTISWLAVQDATLYVLYRDGVQISSGAGLSVVDVALTPLTKYAYNVKAFSGGLYSDLSQTVVVSTLETIP